MITLLSDRYAPTTSRFGFLELPLEEAGEGLPASYAAGLGIHPFDESFYAGPGLLIQTKVKVPWGGKSMTLEDTQRHWGIVPGAADQIPG